MITPALREPQPGWITNVYGPTAFICAHTKGLCRTVIADGGITAELVPVDLVVNGAIAASMKTAVDFSRRRSKQKEDPTWGVVNSKVLKGLQYSFTL